MANIKTDNIEEKDNDISKLQEIDEKLKMLEEKEKNINAKAEEIDEKLKLIEEKGKAIDEKSEAIEKKLPELTQKEIINDSLSIKEELDKQKKIRLVIPVDKQNPKDTDVAVVINGYCYQIKRGEEVEVPYEVYRLLKEAKYI